MYINIYIYLKKKKKKKKKKLKKKKKKIAKSKGKKKEIDDVIDISANDSSILENKFNDTTSPITTNYNPKFKLSESEVKELNPFIDGFNDDTETDKKYSTEKETEEDLPPPLEEMKDENDDTETKDEYLNLTEDVSLFYLFIY